jgi:hypothetical protein
LVESGVPTLTYILSVQCATIFWSQPNKKINLFITISHITMQKGLKRPLIEPLARLHRVTLMVSLSSSGAMSLAMLLLSSRMFLFLFSYPIAFFSI